MSNIKKHNTGRVPWLSVGKFFEDPYVYKFNNLDPWKMKMLHVIYYLHLRLRRHLKNFFMCDSQDTGHPLDN